MKQTIIEKFKEKYGEGKLSSGFYMPLEDVADITSFLESELDTFEKEVREKTLKEVNDFAFDLVWGCVPDCTPEEHQYHQGTWDSYLKLEKWAKVKLKELNTPQEGGGE